MTNTTKTKLTDEQLKELKNELQGRVFQFLSSCLDDWDEEELSEELGYEVSNIQVELTHDFLVVSQYD